MPTQFIAEVSSNHHRDLKRCYSFIDAAARIGCDAVKFQLFRVDQLLLLRFFKKVSNIEKEEMGIPLDYLEPLATYTHKNKLQFSCTPFDLQAVDILKPR